MDPNMKEILDLLSGRANPEFNKIGLAVFALILVISLAFSFYASFCYRHFYGRTTTGSQLQRVFPMLGVSVTAMFICVQFSLPLSLGLLGALSIVRFRTPIKEPEEIGFIMYLIAGAIACATFNFKFLLLLVAAGFIVLVLVNRLQFTRRGEGGCGTLVIRLPATARQTAIAALAARSSFRLESCSAEGDSAVLSWTFRNQEAVALAQLTESLAPQLPGAEINFFFQRAENLLG